MRATYSISSCIIARCYEVLNHSEEPSSRQSFSRVRHNAGHGHSWEVDVFSGENCGLVIAEIELRHEDEIFDRPPWLGIEITGQSEYYNGSLARQPFRDWPSLRRATAVG